MRLLFLFVFLLCISLPVFPQSGWIQQSSQTTETLLGVSFGSNNTGYVCGTSGKLLKTTNGGLNWSALVSGTIGFLRDISFIDDNTGITAGESGIILKTTNGGSNWLNVKRIKYKYICTRSHGRSIECNMHRFKRDNS